MNNEFKTQVNLEIQLDRQDTYEVETQKANLRWNLDLAVRQYGIGSMIISVPDQKLNLSVRVWGDEADSFEDVTLDVTNVEIEQKSSELGSLFPKTMQYSNKKWTLVF